MSRKAASEPGPNTSQKNAQPEPVRVTLHDVESTVFDIRVD